MNMNIFDNAKMEELFKKSDDLVKRGNINVVEINKQKLIVFQDRTIYRLLTNGNHKLIPNIVNHTNGYNRFSCNRKKYYRHRIIGFAFWV